MNKNLKQKRGITLISLVVTIIVLIILAGISISLLFGKSGIITRAKKGQEIVDVSTAQDRLELVKSEIPLKEIENKDSTVNLNNYLEELNKDKNKKDCDVTNIEKLNDINAEITISGKYKFLAKDEENGNVKIIYLGEAGGLQIAPTEATYRYPTAGTFEVINNESQGKLTVKSSNEEIAKASISGTTVTVTPQKMAGTAQILVTSEANGEYAEGRVTHTAKVENGTILLDAEPYIAEYDGKAHDALISVTVDPKDCKLEYSLDGGEFTEIMPKVTMAAEEYTISIKASKEGYTTNAITKTVTINKQSNTNGNIVLTPTSGTITYPNNGTFTVSKNVSGGALSVKSSDESIATASISGTTVTVTPKTPSVNGKQVTITVTSSATSNYEAQTATYVAKIEMGTITINATPYKGTYDGKSHPALTAVSTEPTGTTLRYNLDGKGWQTSIPEVTGAGSYTIAIEASKAGYVTKTKTDTISTINKQTNTNGNLVLTPTSGTITYPNNGTFTVSKNVSGGALSVKSSDESIATASISGTTVTVTPKTPSVNGKQVTITVTSAATSNYEAQTATYIATVKMGTITIDATIYKGTYDGKQYDALTNVKVLPDGCNVEYALNGGKFGSTIPKVTNAGTFSVTVRATKAGYVEKVSTITNGKIDNSTTATASGVNKVYNGSAQTGVTGNNVDWSGTTSATNVGTYTAIVTPKTNYAWSDGTRSQKEITWKITPAEMSLSATIYTGTYDGQAHDAVSNVKVVPTDAKLEYSIDGKTYTTTIPKITNEGGFSVSIRATKNNYITKQITLTNGNINPSKTATASGVNRTYNGSAQTGVTGNNVDWSGTTSATNAGTYTAYATPQTNYAWSDGTKTKKEIKWTIGKAEISLDATVYSGTYDGKAHNAVSNVKVTPTDCKVEYSLNGGTYSSTMPTVTNAGSFSVAIRASKSNYTTKGITKTSKIENAKTATASAVNRTYTGSAQTGVTGNNVDWSGTTSATNAGTYTAYATPKTNYSWSDGKVDKRAVVWKIGEATITITATPYSGTYDGKAHQALTSVKVVPDGCTVTYSLNGGTYSSTMPTVTNVGAFTVSIKATKANYTTKEITINTGKVNYSKASSASGINKVYNGSAQTGVTGQYVTWEGTTSATNVGTYTAYATPQANYAWSDGTRIQKTVQWSITPAEITLDATVYSGTYDGKAHNAVSNVKVTPSDSTVTYSIDGGKTYTSTVPTVTNAESFSVIIKATRANYSTREITKTSKIKPATATASAVNRTYTGSAQTGVSGTNVTWSGSTSGTNAGSYTAYATPKTNYAWSDGTTGAHTITWSIARAKTATASAVNRTYNGSAQTGVTGSYVTWTGDTKGTTAGTYTAYATPDANHTWSNNGGTEKRTITWKIESATISLDFTAYNAMYDGKAHNAVSNVKVTPSDCTITYSISGGAYSTTIPTVTGAAGTTNSYSVSVKATKANYTTREVTKTVYVNKDTVAPSVPTITYNGGSNTCTWKNNYNITLSSTDANSGISGYQVDDNGDGVADRTTGANFIPPNGYHTHNARFRAVDGAGNVSGWTAEQHIHMDTQAPTTPTITYNGGSNTCSWKNNYNLTLSSSDNVAIAYYEIDHDNNGTADQTTAANFVPGNGYSTCADRFRAVDHAGNRSGWTAAQHIHMDTQAPSKVTVNLNGYTSNTYTSGNVTQTASATDNVGIAYYQYTHDGVNVATFPNPWTISWNGEWGFYVRAVDHAGNAGPWSDGYIIRRLTSITQMATASQVKVNGTTFNVYNQAGWVCRAGDSAITVKGNAARTEAINNMKTQASALLNNFAGWATEAKPATSSHATNLCTIYKSGTRWLAEKTTNKGNNNTYYGLYVIKDGKLDYDNTYVVNASGTKSNFSFSHKPILLLRLRTDLYVKSDGTVVSN